MESTTTVWEALRPRGIDRLACPSCGDAPTHLTSGTMYSGGYHGGTPSAQLAFSCEECGHIWRLRFFHRKGDTHLALDHRDPGTGLWVPSEDSGDFLHAGPATGLILPEDVNYLVRPTYRSLGGGTATR